MTGKHPPLDHDRAFLHDGPDVEYEQPSAGTKPVLADRMNTPCTLPRITRFSSLVCGSATLIFLLWMLIGHLVGDANGPNGMRFNNAQEVIAFIGFPVMGIIGLLLAYAWPLAGGAINLLGLALLFCLRPDLLGTGFGLWAIPGLLYVTSGILHRFTRTW